MIVEDMSLKVPFKEFSAAQSRIKELEAEVERLRKRRTEIDDEAFRYAEQVETLRALLWEWMSTQEGDEPVTPELLERTDAALEPI